MTYPEPVTDAGRSVDALPWSIAVAIAAFCVIAVYSTAMSLHTIDIESRSVAADVSISEYHDMLAGVRGYPYQWRLLGTYLVYAGERMTGLDPHPIDLAVKTLLLFVSTVFLFRFSRWYTTEAGAVGVVGFYLLLTVVGFITEQYRIYFTNDYAMIACWFGAVYMLRREQYVAAAALTFVGAWAKETMLLVPVLLAFRAVRTPRARLGLAIAAVAFVVPTAILRSVYRTPLSQWAWWGMIVANVPFFQSSLSDFKVTIKNNVKVALFYNVFWVIAARQVVRMSEPFMRDLAATGVVYLILAYPVIYIRELRHFLPLAIIVLPMAMTAFERRTGDPIPSTAPAQ
jgi:hypothetical protein